MEIPATLVKELRHKTGYGPKLCLDALKEANGDIEKAAEILRKKGEGKAAEMSSRPANQGTIGSYIHFNNQIGVLVEVATQTDSLAQTDEVKEFANGVAIHVAFAKPKYISRDEIPAEIVEKEREIVRDSLGDVSNKPAHVVDKIVDGKMEKFYEENCLLDQKYIQDETKTIGSWMAKIAAQGRENVQIRRIVWFEVGK
ncbi:MAG: translation elongation factor Ts [Planctomycetota bacterium]